ncbi:MAG: deoxyribodipyrimidine photo-lyase, partial [Bauldia sp.]|nr:deoxyribodipyrimidine photo-lyase [Bauldia sp.]
MDSDAPALFWFRDDLRLADNPGLTAACEAGKPLILLYILDDSGDGTRPPGGAARWWLHHSLKSLSADLAKAGQTLVLQQGKARDIVPELVRRTGAREIFWNRRYGHAGDLDADIERALGKENCDTRTFAANHLFEPGTIRSAGDRSFRVFTAFWRAAARMEHGIRAAIAAPRTIPPPPPDIAGAPIEDLDLLPTAPDWAGGLREAWQPGESAVRERLRAFVAGSVADYAERRDFPADSVTSRLSPHLRFGEISPAQIWQALAGDDSAEKFRSELGWREFAWHVLDEQPDLATANLTADFDAFPWAAPDESLLHAWQRGLTGYPIVDAGMRQLWRTGWMHNR